MAMAKRKETAQEIMVDEAITDVTVIEKEEMEFHLINPTEDSFLREIKWNKEELEAGVRRKIAAYENVVYTEDSMKQAKADRTKLNKLTKAIEDRRKMVKNIIMEPYTTFEVEIKEVLKLIEKPVEIIDKQVTTFEEKQKKEKKKNIQVAYDEVIGDLVDVLTFEKIFDSRYLNQTYKLATAQAEIKTKVEKVRTDLETIDSLESKYKINAKDVYIKTFDLSKALAENKRLSDLEEKLEAENRRKAEEEAERKRKAEEKEAERKRIEEEKRLQSTSRLSRIPSSPVSRSVQSVTKAEEDALKPAGNVINHPESVTEPVESVVAPPTGDCTTTDPFAQKDTKQYKASFTIFGTKDEIMGVKQYMIDNDIKFGKVEN